MSKVESVQSPAEAAGTRRQRSRGTLAWVGLLALIAMAIFGSNSFSVRDRVLGSAVPEPAAPVPGREVGGSPAGPAPEQTALRSQPWWQDVTTLEGTGPTDLEPFTIDPSAIQWRVSWQCDSGRLLLRASGEDDPLVDAACPQGDSGYATSTGPVDLHVGAEGDWGLEVAQQIDTPLVEPPLEAMTAPGAATVATGAVYGVDQSGMGEVILYREADGGYSLRLEDFYVTPTVDLELRLSPLGAPESSEEFLEMPSELVTVMDITAGSLNYPVPETIDPTEFQSIVIWCPPIVSAYAAASLEPSS